MWKTLRTVGNSGGDSTWQLSALRLEMISEGPVNLGVSFLLGMLGSCERSGLQMRTVFDEEVHFLRVVVFIFLLRWHGGLQMFPNQLNGPSSVFG